LKPPVLVNATQRGASSPTRWRQFYAGVYNIGTAITRYGTFWPWSPGGANTAPPVGQASSYAGPRVDAESILALDAAWACVWRYASTIATLPLLLLKVGPNNTGLPARDHPLYEILHNSPSTGVTAAAFWQAMVMAMQLWGNAYARKLKIAGRLVGLKIMRPEHVTPYLTPTGELRYRYAPNALTEPEDLSRDDVFHVFDRTMDGLVGVSRIQYARNTMGLAISAERAAGLGYRNGLRATGFVTIANWLNKEKREAYRAEVERFTGAPNDGGAGSQGGVMLLENGMSFEPINMKHADVELLTTRKYSTEQVCRFWDVPPVLVHHAAEGQTMWGTGVSQIVLGWQKTGLAPVLTMIEQAIWLQLISPADRKEFYAEFKLEGLLRGSPAERWAVYQTQLNNGAANRDEVRAYENLAPLPDGQGQKFTVASSLVDLAQLGQNGSSPDAENLRSALQAFLVREDKPTEPASK
jgi:HK97 family phage portal protein